MECGFGQIVLANSTWLCPAYRQCLFTGKWPLPEPRWTLSAGITSSKACLSGEGVAVDKTRKCGLYKAYTALVGSAPLH